jgi:hypothetical protein
MIYGIRAIFEGILSQRQFSGNVHRLGESFGGVNQFITDLKHRFG